MLDLAAPLERARGLDGAVGGADGRLGCDSDGVLRCQGCHGCGPERSGGFSRLCGTYEGRSLALLLSDGFLVLYMLSSCELLYCTT